MALARESHPITDEDLDKKIPQAESILKKINGGDIEETIKNLTPEEKYRIQPEELILIYSIRTAICMYLYFYELLIERTNLKQEVADAKAKGSAATLAINQKRRFISAYSFFVMASSIAARCEKKLKIKDISKLSKLENPIFNFEAGNGIENDLKYALDNFLANLASSGPEGKLIRSSEDILSISRDFWRKFGERAAMAIKECPPELYNLIANTSFRHNKFSITGLIVDDRQEAKIIAWTPIQPEEVIGDPEITRLIARMCDRVAMHDPVVGKNPFTNFGGIVESILFDGPPGTGKTTRLKMMMTRLAKRSEQVSVPYLFKSITADQIKSEWYGKTAQLIAALIEPMNDPAILGLLFVDDIDLLLSDGRDNAGGADKDIMKALMDFFSGTGTNYIGNYIAMAATNKPTASDEALRQRFVYRAAILGPQTWQDYSDLAFQELSKFSKTGLLKVSEGGYKPKSRPLPKEISSIVNPELARKHNRKSGTWDDIGNLCAELRKKDPRFTGRSVKNALQVAVAKAADFEVPEEWFDDPNNFRSRPWDEKLNMVRNLYRPLTADQVMIALEEQFEVEQRYKIEAHEKQVAEIAERILVNQEAELRARKN